MFPVRQEAPRPTQRPARNPTCHIFPNYVEIPNVLLRTIYEGKLGVKQGFSEEFRWQIGWVTQNMSWRLPVRTPTRRFALSGPHQE